MSEHWHEGNQVKLLVNGEDFFPAVLRQIRCARHEVLLETFILFDDDVGQALKKALISAARRGARVQVLADGYGSADLGADYVQELTDAGIKVRLFDPRPKLFGMRTNLFRRLHRKIVVVDGKVAFVGGINFSAEHLASFGPMAKQDYAVQVRGPIVDDLRQACLALLGQRARQLPTRPFHCVSGEARLLLAVRDNHRQSTGIERHYLQALRHARRRILIANAYFFPGYRLMRALRDAVGRGVEVTLILQGQPDRPWVRACSQALYGYLLRDGVRICEYRERPLHAKVAVVDDDWATVGSSNLDPLSLSLNLECNLMIRDRAFNAILTLELERLATQHCMDVTLPLASRHSRWRAMLTFLCYHFMRHFPAIAARLPARMPRLALLGDEPERAPPGCGQEEKSS